MTRNDTPLTDEQRETLEKYKNMIFWHYYQYLAKHRWVDEAAVFEFVTEGAINAVRKYNPDGGASFPTYLDQRIKGAYCNYFYTINRKKRSLCECVPYGEDFNLEAMMGEDALQTDDYDNVANEDSFWNRALEALAPRQRDVVRLYYGKGMTFPQIAKQLGCTLSAACQAHVGALERLRKAIDKGTLDCEYVPKKST